jgi:hypothetical protein
VPQHLDTQEAVFKDMSTMSIPEIELSVECEGCSYSRLLVQILLLSGLKGRRVKEEVNVLSLVYYRQGHLL